MVGEYIDGTLGQLLIAQLQQLPAEGMMLLGLEQAGGPTQGTIKLLLALGLAPAASFAQATAHSLHILQIGCGREINAIVAAQIRLVPGLIAPVGQACGAMASCAEGEGCQTTRTTTPAVGNNLPN